MKILLLLQKGPMSVGEICRESGLEQSLVSHHLRCLTFCGFVTNKRDGKKRIYSINADTVGPLLALADGHIKRFARRLRTCGVLKY